MCKIGSSFYEQFECTSRETVLKVSLPSTLPLRAILQESEAKLEMKNIKPPSIFVWR